MPSILDYVHLTGLLLEETAKYFLLLTFVVLASRLWRRAVKMPRHKKPGNFLLASLTSLLAGGKNFPKAG